jgi:intein/homing endonuclease
VLAEGTVTKPSIVHGAEEGDLVELSRSTFAALGANPVLVDPYKYPSQRGGKKPGQATRVEAPSRVLAAAFTKLFGGTHRRKRVPRFVLDLPRAERIAFLAGYYNGDGCVLPAELGAVTCSAHIAYGIQMLLSSIGVLL